MAKAAFEITGGTALKGSVRVGGAKNASYKLMIAATLGQTESRLLNFSHISDVDAVRNIINYLGGKAWEAGERAIFVDPSTLSNSRLDPNDGAQGRFSTMFIPTLLHRFGIAEVPYPGGDKIGKRPLDWHFDGLRALGATIEYTSDSIIARTEKGLRGSEYTFPKNTHTGTETLLMAAVLAEGTTVLHNAAEEPEIDDMIKFLNGMGAHIERTQARTIEISGVPKLHGTIHKIMPDNNEAVTYACTAITTRGDVIVENAAAADMTAFLTVLDQMNAGYEVDTYGIRFFYKQPLKAVNVTTAPHPGFKTDWQPLLATLLTQCEGTSHLHETVMAKRFQYVSALQQMGAQIEYYRPEVTHPESVYNFNLDEDSPDMPHAIAITGVSPLTAGEFEVVDLRHGATLVSAALAARGTTRIIGIDHIDRGYEDLDARLRSIGAAITRQNTSQ